MNDLAMGDAPVPLSAPPQLKGGKNKPSPTCRESGFLITRIGFR